MGELEMPDEVKEMMKNDKLQNGIYYNDVNSNAKCAEL